MWDRELAATPNANEFEDAIERRTPYIQKVFGAYEVEAGIVRPRGEPVRWYFPITAPGALSEIAAIDPGNERQTLRFIHRWGLLGWYGIKQARGGAAAYSGGDPLPWIWAHANGIRASLALCRWLRRGDEKGLERYIEELTVTDDQAEAAALLGGLLRTASPYIELSSAEKGKIVELGSYAFRASGSGENYGLIVGRQDGMGRLGMGSNVGEPPSSVARRLIAGIVNPHLRGVFPTLEYIFPEFENRYGGVTGLELRYTFDSLVSMLYRQIAEIVLGGRIIECRECGIPFVQTHGRRRFCPPAPWEKGEGRCAARFHTRAKRLAKKKKEADNG